MISNATRDILRNVKKRAAESFTNFSSLIKKRDEINRYPKGLDTSVSGIINAERAFSNFKQLQSQILSGAISTGSSLILKNYVLNFSYVVNPSLKTMSSSMGGYFDVLATAVADQERLKQEYRVLGIQNMLSIGGIALGNIGFSLISAQAMPAFIPITMAIKNSFSGFYAALKNAKSIEDVRKAFTAARTGMALYMAAAGGLTAGILLPLIIGAIKALAVFALIAGGIYVINQALRPREDGEGFLENIYEGLYGFRENLIELKSSLDLSNETLTNRLIESSEAMQSSRSLLERFAAATEASANANAIFGIQAAIAMTNLGIGATNIILGDPGILEELTKIAQNKALMKMFDPKGVNSLFLNNAFLVGTESQKQGIPGGGLGLLVGTEFQDSLYNGTPDDTEGSLASRVYRSAYESMGIDLGSFGIGTNRIISVAANMERETQTGYSEDVMATILSVSGVYSGGATEKMERIMQNIIRSNAFTENDVNMATEKFEEFFAAVVGNGKPQEAHLKMINTLSEFSLSYASNVKLNLEGSSEIAKIHQFLTNGEGTINGRFSAEPTKNLIQSLDNLLLQGATFTNLGAVQILNEIGISRSEAIQGVTSNAEIFELTLRGIIDYMGVTTADILDETRAFDTALQNFSMVSGFGVESMSPLMFALQRYAGGGEIEDIREEYTKNILTHTERSINSVRSSLETVNASSEELALSSNLFNIQRDITYSSNKLISTINLNIDIISSVQSMVNQIVINGFADFATAAVDTLATMVREFMGQRQTASSAPAVILINPTDIGVPARQAPGTSTSVTPTDVGVSATRQGTPPSTETATVPERVESPILNIATYMPIYNALRDEAKQNFTQEFFNELSEISKRVGIPIEHLIAIINFETGGTFNPAIKSGTSSAVGLIQFMPLTAGGLGTTRDELLEMTALEQLEYVEAYFMQPHIQRNVSEGISLMDAYLLVFTPSAAGKGEDYVVYKEGSRGYRSNIGLDVNADGEITNREIAARITSYTDRTLPNLYNPTEYKKLNAEEIGKLIYLDSDSVTVTAPWGNVDDGYHHRGIDFQGHGSKNIYSPVAGVAGVQTSPQLGTTVIVKDAQGNYHIFGHLREAMVEPGTNISKGSILGIEGSTGIGTGSHVHYDVRVPAAGYDSKRFDETFTLDYNTVRQINPGEYQGYSLGGFVFQYQSQNISNNKNTVKKPGNKNMHISIPIVSKNPISSSKLFSQYMKSYLNA